MRRAVAHLTLAALVVVTPALAGPLEDACTWATTLSKFQALNASSH